MNIRFHSFCRTAVEVRALSLAHSNATAQIVVPPPPPPPFPCAQGMRGCQRAAQGIGVGLRSENAFVRRCSGLLRRARLRRWPVNPIRLRTAGRQGRAGQDRAGQGRAGQGRAGQGRKRLPGLACVNHDEWSWRRLLQGRAVRLAGLGPEREVPARPVTSSSD